MLSLMHLREVHIRLSPSVAVEACGSDVRCQTRPDLMDGVSRGDHCHLPPHSSLQQAYKNCTPSPVKPRGTSCKEFFLLLQTSCLITGWSILGLSPPPGKGNDATREAVTLTGPWRGCLSIGLREMVLLLTQLASSAVSLLNAGKEERLVLNAWQMPS